MSNQDPKSKQIFTLPARMKALFAAFLVLSTLALVGAMASIVYLAVESHSQSARNGELLKEVRATNRRLIDCTTPSGRCYQKGQNRTGEAIVGINKGTMRVIVAALSCQADGLTEAHDLARCTAKRSLEAR